MSSEDGVFAEPPRPLSDLLDRVYAFVARYVVVGEHEAVAIALWTVHARVLDAFEASGYLEVRSPVRRCGKTTLLNVLALLVPRPWTTVEPSEAVFFRKITADTPTILLDEVDAVFNKKSEATEGIRACLNAGNQRGWTVPRCVPPRMDIVQFEVFCPKALAGIGGLPDTVTDRSIPIEMRRKQPGDRVERFRSRKARELAAPLVAELEHWGESSVTEVEAELGRVEQLADEGGPLESLDDRAWEQAWEPLLAVASLAGDGWKEAAVAAAVELSGSRDDELDEGVNLLADIRTVFGDYPERESLSTFELLDALLLLEESPWRDWWSDPRSDDLKPSKASPRKLARTLKPFGIRPVDVWMPADVTRKGYRLDDFRDAWARYLLSTDRQEGQDGRESRGRAASDLADTTRESARKAANGRDPRGEPVVSSRSRAPRAPRGYEEDEPQPNEWLARDGRWRRIEDEPPAFPGEVVDTRYGRP